MTVANIALHWQFSLEIKSNIGLNDARMMQETMQQLKLNDIEMTKWIANPGVFASFPQFLPFFPLSWKKVFAVAKT